MKYKSPESELRAAQHMNTRFRLTFYLGGLYTVEGKLCRFVKVTAKGFNFIYNNKCVLKRHLYSYKHKGIPIPEGITQVHTYVPANFRSTA